MWDGETNIITNIMAYTTEAINRIIIPFRSTQRISGMRQYRFNSFNNGVLFAAFKLTFWKGGVKQALEPTFTLEQPGTHSWSEPALFDEVEADEVWIDHMGGYAGDVQFKIVSKTTVALGAATEFTPPTATAASYMGADLGSVTPTLTFARAGGGAAQAAQGPPTTDQAGVWTYTFAATSDNLTTTEQVTLTVQDSVAPTLTLLGAAAVQVYAAGTSQNTEGVFVDPGVAAADDDGDVYVTATVGGHTVSLTSLTGIRMLGAGSLFPDVQLEADQVHAVVFEATDRSGNASASVTRTVTVVSNTVPSVTVVGQGVFEVNMGDSPYVDEGATATDVEDGVLAVQTTLTYAKPDGGAAGNVPASPGGTLRVPTDRPGTLTFTYEATDTDQATAQANRVVTVRNTVPPTLALQVSDPQYVAVNLEPQAGVVVANGAGAYNWSDLSVVAASSHLDTLKASVPKTTS